MQHALMADRRNHEDEHVARHHPMRNRFLQILQRLAAQSLGTRFRMKDPRRHANSQCPLRDPLAGTVEDLTRTRLDHTAEYRPRRITLAQICWRRLHIGCIGWHGRRTECAEIRRRRKFRRQAGSRLRRDSFRRAFRRSRLRLLRLAPRWHFQLPRKTGFRLCRGLDLRCEACLCIERFARSGSGHAQPIPAAPWPWPLMHGLRLRHRVALWRYRRVLPSTRCRASVDARSAAVAFGPGCAAAGGISALFEDDAGGTGRRMTARDGTRRIGCGRTSAGRTRRYRCDHLTRLTCFRSFQYRREAL
jgi:hypothetical protein